MIIDFHVHWSPSDRPSAAEWRANFLIDYAKCWNIKLNKQEIIQKCIENELDTHFNNLVERNTQAGIDKSVVFYADTYDIWGYNNQQVLDHHKELAALCKRHEGKLIPFGSIDPRREDAPNLLRTCIQEYGMKGLKWHPDYGFYPNSPEAYKVLEVCLENKVPLITHTGPLPTFYAKYAHPTLLDEVATDFPDLKIIAAHMGDVWWNDWIALAKYKKNVYGDMAVWQFNAYSNMSRFRRVFRELIEEAGVEQIVFATDAPVFEPGISNAWFIEMMKNLPDDTSDGLVFTHDEIDVILGDNAAKILNL